MTPISDYDRAHPPVDYAIPVIVPTTRVSPLFVILLASPLLWGVIWLAFR